VVDDIGALGAIAVFYTDDLHVVPLIVAFVALGGIFFARRLPISPVSTPPRCAASILPPARR